jgi:hypothetical protein
MLEPPDAPEDSEFVASPQAITSAAAQAPMQVAFERENESRTALLSSD